MKARKGFTLVELIIVVLIIGALAAIAIPRISTSATTAKINSCLANIDTINTQIELYNANNSAWPADLEVVTRDTDYFPDGEPKCPVTDTKYPKPMVNNRVDDSGHNH